MPARSPRMKAAMTARATPRPVILSSVYREALAHGERAPRERRHAGPTEARCDARAGGCPLEGWTADHRRLGPAARRERGHDAARAACIAALASLHAAGNRGESR